jgi:hypothetical protein
MSMNIERFSPAPDEADFAPPLSAALRKPARIACMASTSTAPLKAEKDFRLSSW